MLHINHFLVLLVVYLNAYLYASDQNSEINIE